MTLAEMQGNIRFMNIEQIRKQLNKKRKRWAELAKLSSVSTATIRRISDTAGYFPNVRTLEALIKGLKDLPKG